MKVKLITRSAGPKGCFDPGTILDVSEAIAEEMIRRNQAIYLVAPPPVHATRPAPRPAAGGPRR